MKIKAFAVLAAAVLLAASMTSCSKKSSKDTGVTINVYNWGEYIDESVNDNFYKQTGIKVNYTTYDTNEELYAKLKSGGVSYDVIFPSDYMIGRMISEKMIQKLDYSKITNFSEISSRYKSLDYDPNNEYSVPYMWGTVGIIYNTKMVTDTVDSWSILWNKKYSGKILMFDNSRDAIGIALKKLGYSYNTTDESQLKEAANELKEQKPLVQAYVMDQIFDKMEGGEAALAPYYAGDAITMIEENPDLAFAVPKEGTNVFVDAMAIPSGSKHVEAAEEYINYMSSAEVSAKNAEAIGYSTPNEKALKLLPDDLVNNKIAYPDDSVLDKAETYTNLPDNILSLYDELWTDIISG